MLMQLIRPGQSYLSEVQTVSAHVLNPGAPVLMPQLPSAVEDNQPTSVNCRAKLPRPTQQPEELPHREIPKQRDIMISGDASSLEDCVEFVIGSALAQLSGTLLERAREIESTCFLADGWLITSTCFEGLGCSEEAVHSDIPDHGVNFIEQQVQRDIRFCSLRFSKIQRAADAFCDSEAVPPGEGVVHIVSGWPGGNDTEVAHDGDAPEAIVLGIENESKQLCFLRAGLQTHLGAIFTYYLGLKGESDDLAFSLYSGNMLFDVTTDMTAEDLGLSSFHTFTCKCDNMFDDILKEQLRSSSSKATDKPHKDSNVVPGTRQSELR